MERLLIVNADDFGLSKGQNLSLIHISVKSTGSLVIRRIKFSNFIVTGKQRLTKNFITVVIKPGGCPN